MSFSGHMAQSIRALGGTVPSTHLQLPDIARQLRARPAWLYTYDRDCERSAHLILVPEDFVAGQDDPYGDKIKFTLGSNQCIRGVDHIPTSALLSPDDWCAAHVLCPGWPNFRLGLHVPAVDRFMCPGMRVRTRQLSDRWAIKYRAVLSARLGRLEHRSKYEIDQWLVTLDGEPPVSWWFQVDELEVLCDHCDQLLVRVDSNVHGVSYECIRHLNTPDACPGVAAKKQKQESASC